ncbi:DUF4138 domain-containing protein [Hymenobacter monticola]|uniref:Conjugative transposon protein TraN n=2 Tax=Hymenobacter TaxID=89966 RepID=A0ABY4BFK7_9BACT|nr:MULTISPECIES: DUF4138 domain-containing protein [Hymenobacter]MDU0372275.1 DUF4138 domain-containing protein [Hymenobacter endophyticus]UOE36553.1 conjugative transposon protein TraN [Hymenobacter monticola]
MFSKLLLALGLPVLLASASSAQTTSAPSALLRPSSSAVPAAPTLLDVAVSDSSTTYLVFSGPVSLVDVGMANNYLVKIEANAVFVRARRKSAPPTPMLIRFGSKYWMGRLVYVNRPVLQLYDFQKDGALGLNYGAGSVSGSAPENELALDKEREKKAAVEGKLTALRKSKEEHQSVAVVDNDLVLSLANVRNDRDFTYLRFKVINHSAIDYNVDFTDFQLVENAQKKFLAKKKNEARRPLAPSGGGTNQVVSGRTTGYLTYAIPLYAATDRGYLEVTLRELNGARVLVLPVPSRVINRASTI